MTAKPTPATLPAEDFPMLKCGLIDAEVKRRAHAYQELVKAALVAVDASRRYAAIAPDEVARLKALQDVEFYRALLRALGEE